MLSNQYLTFVTRECASSPPTGQNEPYGWGSVAGAETKASGAMLADLRPALRCPLPNTGTGPDTEPNPSLRWRFWGRAVAGVGVAPLAIVGGLEGWRGIALAAGTEARLADMEGDGDKRALVMPLVWIPGGIGRLIFVAAGVAGDATAVGAIQSGPAAAEGSSGRWERPG